MKNIHNIYLLITFAVCLDVSAAEDIKIVRGTQIGNIRTNTSSLGTRLRAEYAVVEVGRGKVTQKTVEVLFRENSTNRPLPADAILLLHGPSFSKNPDLGSYLLLSPDAAQGAIPYSAEAWAGILQKTDEELSDAPEERRFPVEKATALLRQRLYEKYGTPLHIYFYPPRRVPYSWALSALCVRNGAVKQLRIRVSDTGKIVNETPNHQPIKIFDSMEVTAEEMDQFVREYHRNTPPDEWPRWDSEPPPAESEGQSLQKGNERDQIDN